MRWGQREAQRSVLVAVLAAAALVLLVRSGSTPLTDPDETRFARTSVEMLQSGDIVVPQFGGQPRLVKPPLLHWLQSTLFRLFGQDPWVARLPAAAATLGSLAIVAGIARRRFGDVAAPWAAGILVTMPLVLVPGRVGTLDALLALHVLAVVAIDLACEDHPSSSPSMLTGGLLGFAFLTKGPVGVLLPLVVVLAGRTATGREPLPSASAILRGSAAWCLVVLPWALAFVNRIGLATALETLGTESVGRYFAAPIHSEPPWFYLQVLAVGLLPWTMALPFALVRVWRSRREPSSRTARYLAAGLVAGVIFFSLSGSKLASYLLPLAPMAALLLTWELGRESLAPRRGLTSSMTLALTMAAAAALLGAVGATRLSGTAAAIALVGAALYGPGSLIALHGAMTLRPRRSWAAAAATTWLLMLGATVWLFPEIARRRSAAPLIEATPELDGRRPVVTVEVRVPSLTLILDRHPELLSMEQLSARLDRGDGAVYVMADVDLPDLPDAARDRLREVGRQGKLVAFVGERL